MKNPQGRSAGVPDWREVPTSRFLVPTRGPEDWRALLAEPDKQWRSGYSARAPACCWEKARGFPRSVKTVLGNCSTPVLREAEFLLGVPEHQVALPGGGRPSQTDLWVLARSGSKLVSIAVEGKVSEPFGPSVAEWLVGASPGKRKRLAFLQECLGLASPVPGSIHLHAAWVVGEEKYLAA